MKITSNIILKGIISIEGLIKYCCFTQYMVIGNKVISNKPKYVYKVQLLSGSVIQYT
jgi:hypothetical protein